MLKFKILVTVAVVALIVPLSSKAKAYDNGYNNAAVVGLAALLVSGSELSSAYNNTPRHYVPIKETPRGEVALNVKKPHTVFGKPDQGASYAENQ